MALFQNQYIGQTADGETWSFSWWGDSTQNVDAVHVASQDWLSTFWTGGYDAFVTPDVVATQVNTREITQSDGQQVRLRESAVSLVGVATGSSLPADVAIVVSLRTDLANRRGRGRMYLPQPSNGTQTTEGRIATSTVSGIVSAVGAAFAGVAGTITPVVYSRTARDINQVNSFNVGDLYDTQRRRENKLVESRTSASL